MKVKNTTRRHRVAAAKVKRSVSWMQSRRRANPIPAFNAEEHESCHETCQARR